MIPFTRIIAIAMSAVLCFAVIVPLALRRHNPVLAALISGVFVAYLLANAILWRRMKPRT